MFLINKTLSIIKFNKMQYCNKNIHVLLRKSFTINMRDKKKYKYKNSKKCLKIVPNWQTYMMTHILTNILKCCSCIVSMKLVLYIFLTRTCECSSIKKKTTNINSMYLIIRMIFYCYYRHKSWENITYSIRLNYLTVTINVLIKWYTKQKQFYLQYVYVWRYTSHI